MSLIRKYDCTFRNISDFFIWKGNSVEESNKMAQEELNHIKINYFVVTANWHLIDIRAGKEQSLSGKEFESLDRAKIYQVRNILEEYWECDSMLSDLTIYDIEDMQLELEQLSEIYPEDMI